MQPVRGLVGVHADQGAANAVHRSMEGLDGHVPEDGGERLLDARVEPAPEGERTTDDVLPQAALGLVQRHREVRLRGSRLERRAIVFGRDAVLVEPVAAFVHRGEEGVDVVLVVAGCDSDVLEARVGHERVHGPIEPVVVGCEAEPLDDLQGERMLGVDCKGPAHEVVPLVGGVLGNERDELGLENLEDRANVRRPHARLVVVEQNVVRIVVRGEALCIAEAQLETALEPGPERREVRCLARLDPGLVRFRSVLGERGYELARDASCLLPVAARDLQQARVVGVGGKRSAVRLQLVQQLPDPVVHEPLVDHGLERRELRGTRLRARSRHPDCKVPGQDLLRATEIGDLGETSSQLRKGRIHRAGLYRRENVRLPTCARSFPSQAKVVTVRDSSSAS